MLLRISGHPRFCGGLLLASRDNLRRYYVEQWTVDLHCIRNMNRHPVSFFYLHSFGFTKRNPIGNKDLVAIARPEPLPPPSSAKKLAFVVGRYSTNLCSLLSLPPPFCTENSSLKTKAKVNLLRLLQAPSTPQLAPFLYAMYESKLPTTDSVLFLFENVSFSSVIIRGHQIPQVLIQK